MTKRPGPTLRGAGRSAALLAAVLVLGLLLFPAVAASAPLAQSLSVSPPLQEFSADPGGTAAGAATVTNQGAGRMRMIVAVFDFSVGDEEGRVDISEEPNATYGLAGWMRIEGPEAFELDPGASRTVRFRIEVPRDAPPGGRYGAVVFSQAVDPDPRAVQLAPAVGALVAMRIRGTVVERLGVAGAVAAPGASSGEPVTLAFRLRNQGNVHVRARGTVRITNGLGIRVAELALPESNVFPEAVRRVEVQWPGDVPFYLRPLLAGPHTAVATIGYGTRGAVVISPAATFWYVPAVELGIPVGAAGILLLWRRLRRTRRR